MVILLEIVKIIRFLPLGVTKPYLVECSNGKKYVAKFCGNPDGSRILINEYVSASLGKLLNLPIPNFELAHIELSKFKVDLSNIELIDGTVFCSEWLEKSAPVPGYLALTKTTNKYDAIKILIFDVIIGNNDRNPGNLLINFKNNTLVAIDHSHVFINQAIWDEHTLNMLIGEEIDISRMSKFNYNNLSQCLNDKNYIIEVKEFINKIKLIKRSDIEIIVNSIPNDWNISNNEKKSLIDFLMDRISRIDEICNILNIEGGD